MRNFKNFIRSEKGFSLTELLVVIVIIGILAALSLPKFMSVITRAKSTEAKLMLKQVYQLEKTFYMENDAYSNNLGVIGFEHEIVKTDGGPARYRIEIAEITPAGFIATATSVVDFDKDGVLNVWSINQAGLLLEVTAD
jgi:type IV pilus assembly protein PilE